MKALVTGICGHQIVLDVEDLGRIGGDIVLLLDEGKYVRLTREGNKGICFLDG